MWRIQQKHCIRIFLKYHYFILLIQIEYCINFHKIQFLNLNANSKLTLAYEPTWAIGTGETATVEHIEEIHSKVRSTLESLNIKDIPILYGGSVNPANSNQIIHANNVDGVLVGGASTKFDQLNGIINSI